MKTHAAIKAENVESAQKIIATAKGESRELTADETAQVDAFMDAADEAQAEIERVDASRRAAGRVEAAAQAAQASSRRAPAGSSSANGAAVSPGTPLVAREGWLDDPKRGYSDIKGLLQDAMVAAVGGRASPQLLSLRPSPGFMADIKADLGIQATAGSDEHSTFYDPSLGFMVPTVLMPGVLDTPAPGDPFPDTNKFPMPGPSVEWTARTDKDHSTSVGGGARVYRRAESGTVTSSRIGVEKVTLRAHPLKGVSFETEELLADAPGPAMAVIQRGFQDEFVGRRTYEILNGTGVGEFLGINTSGITVDVPKETGQKAATLVYMNLVKMFARLWGMNGRWVANKTVIPQLASMNGGTNGLVWQPSAREGLPGTLLGMPIQFTEYCEALGTIGDILLVNMSQYLEGTRQDLQTEESIHLRFLENERVFRFTMRNAGAPWWRSVLTPKNGDTLSPFVRLATRS